MPHTVPDPGGVPIINDEGKEPESGLLLEDMALSAFSEEDAARAKYLAMLCLEVASHLQAVDKASKSRLNLMVYMLDENKVGAWHWDVCGIRLTSLNYLAGIRPILLVLGPHVPLWVVGSPEVSKREDLLELCQEEWCSLVRKARSNLS